MILSCSKCEKKKEKNTWNFWLCLTCTKDANQKLQQGKWAEVPREEVATYESANIEVVVLNVPGKGSQQGGQTVSAYVPAWARAFAADLHDKPEDLHQLLSRCATNLVTRNAFNSLAVQCEKHEDVPAAILQLLNSQK